MSYSNDNPIIIDPNSKRNKKQKILCVLCKIELDCVNLEEMRYKCSRCKNTYQLGYEINEYEDELVSSNEDFEDSDDNIGLLCANDDNNSNNDNEYTSKSDIPIPDYFKPQYGQTVEFKETIEKED